MPKTKRRSRTKSKSIDDSQFDSLLACYKQCPIDCRKAARLRTQNNKLNRIFKSLSLKRKKSRKLSKGPKGGSRKTKCKAKTKRGIKCKNYAIQGRTKCAQH